MQQSRVGRKAVILSGLFVNIVFWGGWLWMSKSAYATFNSVLNSSDMVDINVIGLWMPLGFFGACLYGLASPIVAFSTGVKSNIAWGALGNKIANYTLVIFAILGVLTAIGAYQWMTSQLEGRGYLYCKPLSRISAMGRHEVYVARPELCVKPSKIP